MEARFWMCWVEGTRGSSCQHRSLKDANDEARRLALMPENQGKCVYVLEATGYYYAKASVYWAETW